MHQVGTTFPPEAATEDVSATIGERGQVLLDTFDVEGRRISLWVTKGLCHIGHDVSNECGTTTIRRVGVVDISTVGGRHGTLHAKHFQPLRWQHVGCSLSISVAGSSGFTPGQSRA